MVEPGLGAYSASKAGVVQLGKMLARQWVRHGINVNMLCPDYVKTELNGEWFEKAKPARGRSAGSIGVG